MQSLQQVQVRCEQRVISALQSTNTDHDPCDICQSSRKVDEFASPGQNLPQICINMLRLPQICINMLRICFGQKWAEYASKYARKMYSGQARSREHVFPRACLLATKVRRVALLGYLCPTHFSNKRSRRWDKIMTCTLLSVHGKSK